MPRALKSLELTPLGLIPGLGVSWIAEESVYLGHVPGTLTREHASIRDHH